MDFDFRTANIGYESARLAGKCVLQHYFSNQIDRYADDDEVCRGKALACTRCEMVDRSAVQGEFQDFCIATNANDCAGKSPGLHSQANRATDEPDADNGNRVK